MIAISSLHQVDPTQILQNPNQKAETLDQKVRYIHALWPIHDPEMVAPIHQNQAVILGKIVEQKHLTDNDRALLYTTLQIANNICDPNSLAPAHEDLTNLATQPTFLEAITTDQIADLAQIASAQAIEQNNRLDYAYFVKIVEVCKANPNTKAVDLLKSPDANTAPLTFAYGCIRDLYLTLRSAKSITPDSNPDQPRPISVNQLDLVEPRKNSSELSTYLARQFEQLSMMRRLVGDKRDYPYQHLRFIKNTGGSDLTGGSTIPHGGLSTTMFSGDYIPKQHVVHLQKR